MTNLSLLVGDTITAFCHARGLLHGMYVEHDCAAGAWRYHEDGL